MSNTLVAFYMRPISVPTDSVDLSVPSECAILWDEEFCYSWKQIQQNVVMWLSTGSYDSEMITLLDDGPVPPMMTKVSGKCLSEVVGFCPVWFNFVVSNQIKGLRGVFPERKVGQTSHISVSTSQHAHWFTFFLFNPLYPQSDWMSSGRGGQGIEGFTCFRTRTSLRGAGVHKPGFGTCTFVSSSLDKACLLLGNLNCLQMQNFSQIVVFYFTVCVKRRISSHMKL